MHILKTYAQHWQSMTYPTQPLSQLTPLRSQENKHLCWVAPKQRVISLDVVSFGLLEMDTALEGREDLRVGNFYIEQKIN